MVATLTFGALTMLRALDAYFSVLTCANEEQKRPTKNKVRWLV
jgi:hypothetical protein